MLFRSHTLIKSHEVVDAPDAQPVPIERGRIEFQDVSFGYTNEQLIFQHLDVVIPAGQRVGLVGFSGSGKSTFVSLILRINPSACALRAASTTSSSVASRRPYRMFSINVR